MSDDVPDARTMSESFPNPFGAAEERAEPPRATEESDDEELTRALRESLAFQDQAAERQQREEQEALEAAIAASRAEDARRRQAEEQSLLQERQALEQSRQEARRREAERQRQTLMEREVIEQSRREHEADLRYRASMSPPRKQTEDYGTDESLLWLSARQATSGRSTPALGRTMSPAFAPSSSKFSAAQGTFGLPPSYTPSEELRNPYDDAPTPQAQKEPLPSVQAMAPSAYAPQAPAVHTPEVRYAAQGAAPPAQQRPAMPAPINTNPFSTQRDEPPSASSDAPSDFSINSATLPKPPPSRYEAALAAGEAEYEQESEDSWAPDSGEEQLWRGPAGYRDEPDEPDEPTDLEPESEPPTAYAAAMQRSETVTEAPAAAEYRHAAFGDSGAYTDQLLEELTQESTTPVPRHAQPPPPPTAAFEPDAAPEMDLPNPFDGPKSAQYGLDEQPWEQELVDPYDRVAPPVRTDAHPPPSASGEPPPTPASPGAPTRTNSRSTGSSISSRRDSMPGVPYPPEHASGQLALRGVQFGYAQTPYDIGVYVTPTASAPLYASPELVQEPHIPMDAMAQPEERLQLYFPEKIELRPDAPRPWFVMRAYSWKVLLQALAWYGHTSLVPAVPGGRLHTELVFSIPKRYDAAQEAAASFVSLAMGLSTNARPHSTQALDAFAAQAGASLTPVSLAQHALSLPTDFVTLAQTLFSAPQLSSAPALRELRQAIARQDEWLELRKGELEKRTRTQMAQAADAGATIDRTENLEWGMLHHQLSLLQHPGALPTNVQTEAPTGHREHLRQRVKKKFARWNAGNAQDQDLAAWITPYDLSQHGAP